MCSDGVVAECLREIVGIIKAAGYVKDYEGDCITADFPATLEKITEGLEKRIADIELRAERLAWESKS